MKREAEFRSSADRVFHVFRAKRAGVRTIVIVEMDRRILRAQDSARGGLLQAGFTNIGYLGEWAGSCFFLLPTTVTRVPSLIETI